MKLIYTAALLLIASIAQAGEQSNVLPINVYPPKGDGDGSLWKVSFTPSYLDEAGESVTQPTVTLSVKSGSCGYGATNIVKMRGGFSAKVSQKVCVGSVNGKNVIVGWLVAPGRRRNPWSALMLPSTAPASATCSKATTLRPASRSTPSRPKNSRHRR